MSKGDVGTRDAGADILHPCPAPTRERDFSSDPASAEWSQWPIVGATRHESQPARAHGANWIGIEVDAPHCAPLSSGIVPEVNPTHSVEEGQERATGHNNLAHLGRPH